MPPTRHEKRSGSHPDRIPPNEGQSSTDRPSSRHLGDGTDPEAGADINEESEMTDGHGNASGSDADHCTIQSAVPSAASTSTPTLRHVAAIALPPSRPHTPAGDPAVDASTDLDLPRIHVPPFPTFGPFQTSRSRHLGPAAEESATAHNNDTASAQASTSAASGSAAPVPASTPARGIQGTATLAPSATPATQVNTADQFSATLGSTVAQAIFGALNGGTFGPSSSSAATGETTASTPRPGPNGSAMIRIMPDGTVRQMGSMPTPPNDFFTRLGNSVSANPASTGFRFGPVPEALRNLPPAPLPFPFTRPPASSSATAGPDAPASTEARLSTGDFHAGVNPTPTPRPVTPAIPTGPGRAFAFTFSSSPRLPGAFPQETATGSTTFSFGSAANTVEHDRDLAPLPTRPGSAPPAATPAAPPAATTGPAARIQAAIGAANRAVAAALGTTADIDIETPPPPGTLGTYLPGARDEDWHTLFPATRRWILHRISRGEGPAENVRDLPPLPPLPPLPTVTDIPGLQDIMNRTGGTANFVFTFGGGIPHELRPDPQRATKMMKNLRTMTVRLMRRLERVSRKERSMDEGSDEGWKCSVCLDGWEGAEQVKIDIKSEDAPGSSGSVGLATASGSSGESQTRDKGKAKATDESPQPGKRIRVGLDAKTDIKALPCNHFFHKDCLEPWFATKHTCPSCRYDVLPYIHGLAALRRQTRRPEPTTTNPTDDPPALTPAPEASTAADTTVNPHVPFQRASETIAQSIGRTVRDFFSEFFAAPQIPPMRIDPEEPEDVPSDNGPILPRRSARLAERAQAASTPVDLQRPSSRVSDHSSTSTHAPSAFNTPVLDDDADGRLQDRPMWEMMMEGRIPIDTDGNLGEDAEVEPPFQRLADIQPIPATTGLAPPRSLFGAPILSASPQPINTGRLPVPATAVAGPSHDGLPRPAPQRQAHMRGTPQPPAETPAVPSTPSGHVARPPSTPQSSDTNHRGFYFGMPSNANDDQPDPRTTTIGIHPRSTDGIAPWRLSGSPDPRRTSFGSPARIAHSTSSAETGGTPPAATLVSRTGPLTSPPVVPPVVPAFPAATRDGSTIGQQPSPFANGSNDSAEQRPGPSISLFGGTHASDTAMNRAAVPARGPLLFGTLPRPASSAPSGGFGSLVTSSERLAGPSPSVAQTSHGFGMPRMAEPSSVPGTFFAGNANTSSWSAPTDGAAASSTSGNNLFGAGELDHLPPAFAAEIRRLASGPQQSATAAPAPSNGSGTANPAATSTPNFAALPAPTTTTASADAPRFFPQVAWTSSPVTSPESSRVFASAWNSTASTIPPGLPRADAPTPSGPRPQSGGLFGFGNAANHRPSGGVGAFGSYGNPTVPTAGAQTGARSSLFGGNFGTRPADSTSSSISRSTFGQPAQASAASSSGTATFGGFSQPDPAVPGIFGSAGAQPAVPRTTGTGALFGGFGTSSNPPASTSSFGGFGAASSTGRSAFGGFGTSSNPPASTSTFGGFGAVPSARAPAFGGFGSSNATAAPTGMFGGTSSHRPTVPGNLFGSSHAVNSGLFGSGSGTALQGSLFGSDATPNESRPMFGFGSASATSAAPSQFGFGIASARPTPAPTASSGFTFGNASAASTPAPASSGSFSFGNPNAGPAQSITSPASFSFSGPPAQPTPANAASRPFNLGLGIARPTAVPAAASGFSFGATPTQPTPAPAPSNFFNFGASRADHTPAQTTGFRFGAPVTQSAAGHPLFGTARSDGGSEPLFGNPAPRPSLLSQPSATTTSTTNLFGNASTAAPAQRVLFGGEAPRATANSASNGVSAGGFTFGAARPAPSASSLFGVPRPAPQASSGIFGAPAATADSRPPALGATSTTITFGGSAAPQSSSRASLFGQPHTPAAPTDPPTIFNFARSAANRDGSAGPRTDTDGPVDNADQARETAAADPAEPGRLPGDVQVIFDFGAGGHPPGVLIPFPDTADPAGMPNIQDVLADRGPRENPKTIPLRTWLEKREQALGWRCSRQDCEIMPKDEDSLDPQDTAKEIAAQGDAGVDLNTIHIYAAAKPAQSSQPARGDKGKGKARADANDEGGKRVRGNDGSRVMDGPSSSSATNTDETDEHQARHELTGERLACEHRLHPACLRPFLYLNDQGMIEDRGPRIKAYCPRCLVQGWVDRADVDEEGLVEDIYLPTDCCDHDWHD